MREGGRFRERRCARGENLVRAGGDRNGSEASAHPDVERHHERPLRHLTRKSVPARFILKPAESEPTVDDDTP
jgi:hypothetical protein